jgi:hypothetical protein
MKSILLLLIEWNPVPIPVSKSKRFLRSDDKVRDYFLPVVGFIDGIDTVGKGIDFEPGMGRVCELFYNFHSRRGEGDHTKSHFHEEEGNMK